MYNDFSEKSLVKVDNSIFGKIKMFFTKLFNKNELQENIITQNVVKEDNNFVDNIKFPEKKLNLRLEKMRMDLESGEIIEEDLCEQELQELREFYLQQIEEKKQSIENYKNRIIKIKEQLKL